MTPDEFRLYGHEVVDWIAGYLADIRELPVLPAIRPGELTEKIPGTAPEQGEQMDAILRDFRELIVPANTQWNHPRFFAYFSVSASAPGILAEMLASALNVNGMLWKSSPAATELELITVGWLRDWLGLPNDFFGLIYDTASISSLHAIAAAREMADPEARIRGGTGDLVLYTSEHSHSSIEKGAIALGLGQQNVRRVPVDADFRMRPEILRAQIEQDKAAGKHPFFVAATVGTTSTSSIDPVPAIAEIAQERGMWLHVDAAYGGSAAIIPEFRCIFDGVERADSMVINPHKWLFTPIDVSVFYTRRPDVLRRAFTLVPEYLKTNDDPHVVNLMDYGVPLGRRFRALKLWFVFRYFGREGVIATLRNHISWAGKLAHLIAANRLFEIAAPTPLSLVCFRFRGSDDQNRVLLERINASGNAFLSHTVLNGRYVLRLAIGHIATTWGDLQETWELIQIQAENL